MDAILTAGGIPEPGDPLYEYTLGENKALVDIAGKPMIQWVLDALCEAKSVDSVTIVGLPENGDLTCRKPVTFVPGHGSMLNNIRVGVTTLLESKPGVDHVLAVSSDIPAIRPEMVDWLVGAVHETDEDLYYTVIPRAVMEARFPTSRRSYVKLKDMQVCGGDMNALRASLVTQNEELWERIVAARKNMFKQAALIGIDTLFLLLLRRITLERGVNMVTSRLHLDGRAIVCPYAEVGMDVDKPHQLEILRADLSSRVLV